MAAGLPQREKKKKKEKKEEENPLLARPSCAVPPPAKRQTRLPRGTRGTCFEIIEPEIPRLYRAKKSWGGKREGVGGGAKEGKAGQAGESRLSFQGI
jgi:hypothetical protein